MSLKISKDNVQDLSNAITPFVEKAISYARPICDNVIQNPQKYITGTLGICFLIDDLKQRVKNRDLKNDMHKSTKVLKKQEVEIQELNSKAKKAEKLKAVNEDLCKLIKTMKAESDEEIED